MFIEELLFDTDPIEETAESDQVFVLIIYDIINDKKRNRLAKLLKGYGFRIQKSAFEAKLPKNVYHRLLSDLEPYGTEEDSVRVYKIIGKGQVTVFGKEESIEQEDVIIL